MAPFVIKSTTKVDNLNVDLFDGKHSTDFDLKTDQINSSRLVGQIPSNLLPSSSGGSSNYTPAITSSTSGNYKIGDLTIGDSSYELYGKDTNTTYKVASTSANGLMSIADKTFIDSLAGYSTATAINKIPVTSRLCVATISANGSFTLSGTLESGRELHVIIVSKAASVLTVSIPTTFTSAVEFIEIQPGKFEEINVIAAGTTLYLRTS